MFAKYLLATIGIVVLATPALSDQFYIVQDAATKRCAIAEQPPSESAGIAVGDGAYGDRGSAEADMRTIYACISQAAGSDNHKTSE
jgi:hypothetical protein